MASIKIFIFLKWKVIDLKIFIKSAHVVSMTTSYAMESDLKYGSTYVHVLSYCPKCRCDLKNEGLHAKYTAVVIFTMRLRSQHVFITEECDPLWLDARSS